jgi:RNA polymerase sigma-70 factor, ECF subfamily
MDDHDLAHVIQAGREDAVSEFTSRFRPRIEAVVRNRGVPSRDRDDVVQDILSDAIRQLQQGRFREAAALSTWVYRIALGKTVDYWRKPRPTALLPLEDIKRGDEALIATRNEDAVLAVRQALGRLSAEDRLILHLHEQQGYTLEEMTVFFRLKKSALAERLAHARERFRVEILRGGKNADIKRLTG